MTETHLTPDESVQGARDSRPSVLTALVRRTLRIGLRFVLVFIAIILVGLFPVNNGFQSTPDGIEVFVTSNPVHAEIVMPIESTVINWRKQFPTNWFPQETGQATHVAIGWGDRGFFLKTPTWADFKVSVAANALFMPSDTCMHVTMKPSVTTGPNTRPVRISEQQYTQLVNYINDAFRRDSKGQVVQVKGEHYGWNDAFFESHGTYHFLNTCNSWVGRGLQRAGMPVGWMTPLPKTVFWYLPEQGEPGM